MKYTSILVLLATASLVAACSSDDSSDSGPSTVNSGLPEDKLLSQLTAEEIATLNKATSDYGTAKFSTITKADACQFMGVMMAGLATMGDTATDASLQSSCTTAVDSCVKSTSDSSGSSTSAAPPESTTTLTDCTATVAEFQSCSAASIDATVTLMKSMPQCSTLTVTSMTSTTDSPMATATPASCEALSTKCPNLATTADTADIDA